MGQVGRHDQWRAHGSTGVPIAMMYFVEVAPGRAELRHQSGGATHVLDFDGVSRLSFVPVASASAPKRLARRGTRIQVLV